MRTAFIPSVAAAAQKASVATARIPAAAIRASVAAIAVAAAANGTADDGGTVPRKAPSASERSTHVAGNASERADEETPASTPLRYGDRVETIGELIGPAHAASVRPARSPRRVDQVVGREVLVPPAERPVLVGEVRARQRP